MIIMKLPQACNETVTWNWQHATKLSREIGGAGRRVVLMRSLGLAPLEARMQRNSHAKCARAGGVPGPGARTGQVGLARRSMAAPVGARARARAPTGASGTVCPGRR